MSKLAYIRAALFIGIGANLAGIFCWFIGALAAEFLLGLIDAGFADKQAVSQSVDLVFTASTMLAYAVGVILSLNAQEEESAEEDSRNFPDGPIIISWPFRMLALSAVVGPALLPVRGLDWVLLVLGTLPVSVILIACGVRRRREARSSKPPVAKALTWAAVLTAVASGFVASNVPMPVKPATASHHPEAVRTDPAPSAAESPSPRRRKAHKSKTAPPRAVTRFSAPKPSHLAATSKTCFPAIDIDPVSIPAVHIPATTIPATTINGTTYPAHHYKAIDYPARKIPGRHIARRCFKTSHPVELQQTSVFNGDFRSLDPEFSSKLSKSYWGGSGISAPDPSAPGFGELNDAGFPRNQYVRPYVRRDGTSVSGYWRNAPSDGLPTCQIIDC